MAHIDLVTEAPGPESRKVIERHERHVTRALSLGFPAVVREAEGALLTDVMATVALHLVGEVWPRRALLTANSLHRGELYAPF